MSKLNKWCVAGGDIPPEALRKLSIETILGLLARHEGDRANNPKAHGILVSFYLKTGIT